MKKQSHKAALNEIINRSSQELIQAVNGLEKVLAARTLAGAKRAAEKALKKAGYL